MPWSAVAEADGSSGTGFKLYEEGKIDGMQRVYIKDGKIVTREESFKGPSPSISEGMSYQFAQKYSYDNGLLESIFTKYWLLYNFF